MEPGQSLPGSTYPVPFHLQGEAGMQSKARLQPSPAVPEQPTETLPAGQQAQPPAPAFTVLRSTSGKASERRNPAGAEWVKIKSKSNR